MPAPGLEFLVQRPAAAPALTRADVAVFVGLVARRKAALPERVRLALRQAGWRHGGTFPVSEAEIAALLGIPVPFESWAEFDALFDWRSRSPVPGAPDRLPCPLGLAVRQFFLQGGARAWIVRCGDPLPLTDAALTAEQFTERQLTALAGPIARDADAVPILPGLLDRSRHADPLDPATWTGTGTIYALDDAAMLLLPDLPDLASGPAEVAPPPPEPPAPPEAFRPCAARPSAEPEAEPRTAAPAYKAPRLGRHGYRLWSAALAHALDLLGRPHGPAHRRDVMLVGALPLPETESPQASEQWPLELLATPGNAGTDRAPLALFDQAAIGSARLQLAYPWLATPDAAACPEGLQSPEGALAGLLARSALDRGGFRSAAGRALASPTRLEPRIPGSTAARGLPGRAAWLGDRLCLFAERRGRIELVSDATMAQDRAWRKGGVSRLIATLLRACRHIGEDLLFEPSGPALWARLESQVTAVCESLRVLGGFDGLTPAECYQVTCNRSIMSAADLDAGRVRCEVIVHPASPVERIVVMLALLEPVPRLAAEAA